MWIDKSSDVHRTDLVLAKLHKSTVQYKIQIASVLPFVCLVMVSGAGVPVVSFPVSLNR